MRVAIVGTGLIGASIGLAAKSAGVERVVGFDQDPESLRVANERGALDEQAASVEEAVSGAELAFVATPVATLVHQVGGCARRERRLHGLRRRLDEERGVRSGRRTDAIHRRSPGVRV